MNCSFRYLAMACLLAMAGGCMQESWKADTYPVTGNVIINGEKPENAIITLIAVGTPPDSRHSRPWGFVKADGSYRLTTYKVGDGCPPGEYAVTVIWPISSTGPSPDRMKNKYRDATDPVMTVTVQPSENILPTIELTGVKMLPTS